MLKYRMFNKTKAKIDNACNEQSVCQGLRMQHISLRGTGVSSEAGKRSSTLGMEWSCAVRKNLIPKLRSELSAAVQTLGMCPLRFFLKVKQEWKELLMCKRQLLDSFSHDASDESQFAL